ncbi:MAG: sigma-70 family RNA polymerase sigma factor, partial [Bacteroidota bacterium]
TYLNKIFYNKCIDIIRKYASNRVDAYEEVPDRVDQDDNIIRRMSVQDDFQQLVSMLGQLGDTCKQIILDSEYHGYNSEEIAERVGFSNARSVNSKKYSCLQRLKKMIEGAPSKP